MPGALSPAVLAETRYLPKPDESALVFIELRRRTVSPQTVEIGRPAGRRESHVSRMSVPAAPVPPNPDAHTDLVRALARSECYPHRPVSIETVQTHISTVFLADQLVYKLKKPVRFSFLDYSTPALRRRYCQEEVRLNRRLAPTVYLGVVTVRQRDGRYWIDEGVSARPAAGTSTIDFMVKMRRLSTERTLGARLETGRVTSGDIQAVSRRLYSFHATAATDSAAAYGTPKVIWRAFEENFQDIEPFRDQTLGDRLFTAIVTFSRQFFSDHQELFIKRAHTGRVVDGHGDLRCDHVYFLDDGISIVDCIEFSPRLRTCDVASDLAFLAMDLELHGAPALAAELVNAYQSRAQDSALPELFPFYQCYRACVRGKVASLKSRAPEATPDEQDEAHRHAQHAFRLAARYARGKPSPALLIVCGRIGTGKSTVSRLLSDHTGFAVFNSDVVRKRLAGVVPTQRGDAAYGAGMYTPEVDCRTYAQLRHDAENQLRAGWGVIVDATCKNPTERRSFLELAARLNVPVLFLECQARAREVERRLRERERRGDAVSDATWNIARQAWDAYPAFDDLFQECHRAIDTEAEVEDRLFDIAGLLTR